MFARILTSALLAGAAAGLIAGLLQLLFVQPVLLHAELYESGKLVHFGAETVSARQATVGIDLKRDGLSMFFSMLIYCGYALVLVSGMAVANERGSAIDARAGILWGIAGFVTVHLAPAFSLAPEVPGVAAADLAPRQAWWFATVAMAGIAMWLIAFARGWAGWLAAAALLLAPHLYGAPEPEAFAGTAPPEIAALFASRALGVGLAAWVMLGLLAGYFWEREAAHSGAPQTG